MRLFVLSTMLVIAVVSAVSTGSATLAKSIHLPVNPSSETLAGHPLVGDWLEITSVGAVPAAFAADGSVVIRFPDVVLGNLGNSFVGGGYGTWEPVGERGAVYTVVRTVSHANGMSLSTITIQGYLTLSADGLTFTDDGLLTTITTRDAHDRIISVTGVNAGVPAVVASRIAVGQTGIAKEPVAFESAAEASRGGGCITCR